MNAKSEGTQEKIDPCDGFLELSATHEFLGFRFLFQIRVLFALIRG